MDETGAEPTAEPAQRSSADTRRLREFAARNHLAYVWLDVETSPAASMVLHHHGIGPDETPIVVMRGGEVLRNPSNAELARAAGFGSGGGERRVRRALRRRILRPLASRPTETDPRRQS